MNMKNRLITINDYRVLREKPQYAFRLLVHMADLRDTRFFRRFLYAGVSIGNEPKMLVAVASPFLEPKVFAVAETAIVFFGR